MGDDVMVVSGDMVFNPDTFDLGGVCSFFKANDGEVRYLRMAPAGYFTDADPGLAIHSVALVVWSLDLKLRVFLMASGRMLLRNGRLRRLLHQRYH